MSLTLLMWGTEEMVPTYWGYIDQEKIQADDNSIMIRSLGMNCDKCNTKGNWRILEAKQKNNLFFIIPLGTTKRNYKMYCNKCNAFQMMVNKIEMDELIKKEIAIKSKNQESRI